MLILLVLGASQFCKWPLKIMLVSKVVQNRPEIIILLLGSFLIFREYHDKKIIRLRLQKKLITI